MRRDKVNQFMNMAGNSSIKFFILLSAVTSVLILELSLSNISDLINIASNWGIYFFILSAAMFIVTQYVTLLVVRYRTSSIRANLPHVKAFHRIVTLVQYILVGILGFTILQIVIFSYYHIFLLLSSSSISWTLAGISMFLLSARFFSWYKSSKSFIILSYAFSSATAGMAMMVSFVFYGILLLDMPLERTAESEVTFETVDLGWETMFQQTYTIFNIMFFVLLWISTALLLRHHSQRLGHAKYWFVISLPLASYLSIFFVIDRIVEASPHDLDLVYVVILGYTLPNVVSGVLFGIPFWSVANSLRQGNVVREYMMIAGFGFVLFFVAGTATVDHAPYPPLGLVSVCFIGLSSYLIFIGLYYSAILVSEDARLRQSIRKSIRNEVGLLDNIGGAELQQQIEKKVIEVIKSQQKNIIADTGIETSMEEDEVKQYLGQVIEELRKNKDK